MGFLNVLTVNTNEKNDKNNDKSFINKDKGFSEYLGLEYNKDYKTINYSEVEIVKNFIY